MHHFTWRLSVQSAYFITICFSMETINRHACSHAASADQFPSGPLTLKVAKNTLSAPLQTCTTPPGTGVLNRPVRVYCLSRTWQRSPAFAGQEWSMIELPERSRIMPLALPSAFRVWRRVLVWNPGWKYREFTCNTNDFSQVLRLEFEKPMQN
jgi:hypothetical protein